METWAVVLVCVTSGLNIVDAAFNAFFKGYAEKKGANLATKEDLKDVVDQVKIVTRTTEEIKTELSERAWAKQQHWDMKREVAFEVTRIFGELEQILNHIFHIRNPQTMAKAQVNAEMAKDHVEDYKAALEQYLGPVRKLWQTREAVALVFSKEASKEMDGVQNALALLVSLLGDDTASGMTAKAKQRDAVRRQQKVVSEIVRKELGIVSAQA